ncbi:MULTISPECIES: hypothetical protein [Chitinophagaceae]|uniref:Uncharacterized protein n=1 Tax=Niabella digestorum TaxID=3117701 RepID=A0ABU7RD14_9BACT
MKNSLLWGSYIHAYTSVCIIILLSGKKMHYSTALADHGKANAYGMYKY